MQLIAGVEALRIVGKLVLAAVAEEIDQACTVVPRRVPQDGAHLAEAPGRQL